MKDPHYMLIIEKTKSFIRKLDGDDVNELWVILDNLDENTNKLTKLHPLLDDLSSIVNAMWCEHGLDYGKGRDDYDEIVADILETFKDGYEKNEADLTKLINLILSKVD